MPHYVECVCDSPPVASSYMRTRAISGSQPYANHTARFYCESAALPGYGRTCHSERFQPKREPYRYLAPATTSGGGVSTEPPAPATIDEPFDQEQRTARPANQRDSLVRTPRRGTTVRQGGIPIMTPRWRAPSMPHGPSHAISSYRAIGRCIPASRTQTSWATIAADVTNR